MSDTKGLMSSLRPKLRPSLEIPYHDSHKIERVVYAEAKGEGVEGRNAVRGVILNRLASDRFPNTVDEVLSAEEFEPVRKYGGVFKIPAPQEELEKQYAEFADYVQLGEDAVDGRTFFQNTETTKKRGTSFNGPDPVKIGKHTFYRGYRNQEPVYDTAGSHNVKITYPDTDTLEYALGGIATATRGITTKEGREMAQKKFQLDDKKADLDGNNEVSAYERARGEAIQKNLQDAPEDEVMSGDKRETVQMYHGGMSCGCGNEEECGCGGMDGIMGYDEVSGNPIPLGATPENVRDDIDANISTDEFVLPAHVVKWHGIKHIMSMYDEAEMGFMGMKMSGLIQHAEEAPVEEEVVDEPEEDVDVEIAAVEVDDKMDDTEDTEKVLPQTSSLPGMVKKQKIAFLY